MATQQVISIAVPPQVPAAFITQDGLGHILELRRQIEALGARLAEAEGAVKTALESGTEIEVGPFRAMLKTYERRSVAWKAIVERELGEDYARRVFNATRPDTHTQLLVSA